MAQKRKIEKLVNMTTGGQAKDKTLLDEYAIEILLTLLRREIAGGPPGDKVVRLAWSLATAMVAMKELSAREVEDRRLEVEAEKWRTARQREIAQGKHPYYKKNGELKEHVREFFDVKAKDNSDYREAIERDDKRRAANKRKKEKTDGAADRT